MRRLFLFLVVCLMAVFVHAQNIQLHYDFGSALYNSLDTRPKVTTTVEMFKPDRWGSTYFFIDMDYTKNGVAGAYWEIFRELKFWEPPFSVHVEYNGGLNYINNAYLLGATYTWNNATFTKGFTFTPMYKYIQKNPSPNSFQLTASWYLHFCQGKCTFSGFADFWREEHTDAEGNRHDYVFLTEPQFWVNLNKFKGIPKDFNLSLGTEWEITSNFALMEGWHWLPTLAMKWTF